MARNSSSYVGPLILFCIPVIFFIYGWICEFFGNKIKKEAESLFEKERNKFLSKLREDTRHEEDILIQKREKLNNDINVFNRNALLEREKIRTERLEQANIIESERKKFDIYIAEEREKFRTQLLGEREKSEDEKKQINDEIQLKNKCFEEKTIGFPWVAEQLALYKDALGEFWEDYLRCKRNPSSKSADIIREMRKRTKKAEKTTFIYQGIINYYESLFPWLTEFRDAPDEIISRASAAAEEETQDPARKLLSVAEWANLTTSEKYQRALDRYKKRHKTNWEIGREFERFIGYKYEIAGWDVTYFGSIKGLEDMGRDIIAQRNGTTHIVQCKYWSEKKIIHEKHLFQLYGTCIVYGIEHKLTSPPKGVFVTSCKFSDTAKKVAEALGINITEDIKIEEYPCIKCNINEDKEKIYHLPFDQQYDKIKMSKNKARVFAETIADAEAAGFRRAYRWHGQN